jgi:hypothetical protein
MVGFYTMTMGAVMYVRIPAHSSTLALTRDNAHSYGCHGDGEGTPTRRIIRFSPPGSAADDESSLMTDYGSLTDEPGLSSERATTHEPRALTQAATDRV